MADKRFVIVVTPGIVKPLRDGSKCAIIWPGGSERKIKDLTEAVDGLRTAPHMSILTIKPSDVSVEIVEVSRVEDVRGA